MAAGGKEGSKPLASSHAGSRKSSVVRHQKNSNHTGFAND